MNATEEAVKTNAIVSEWLAIEVGRKTSNVVIVVRNFQYLFSTNTGRFFNDSRHFVFVVDLKKQMEINSSDPVFNDYENIPANELHLLDEWF